MSDLSIRCLTKRYGKTAALDRADLDIPAGRFGLLGPNGAGKTTMLRILATLLEPSSGTITKGPFDWQKNQTDIRRSLGYLPQQFGMYRYLKVHEALDHFATLKRIPHSQITYEIESVLEKTNLTEERDKKISALSGGMIRRLGIAQALLGQPDLLLLDEPTVGLDPEERIRFRSLLTKINREQTVILSTHLVDDVQSSCTHAAVIHKGRILASGTIQNLIALAKDRIFTYETSASDEEPFDRTMLIISRDALPDDRIRFRFAGQSPCTPYIGQPAAATLEDTYMILIHGADPHE